MAYKLKETQDEVKARIKLLIFLKRVVKTYYRKLRKRRAPEPKQRLMLSDSAK